MLTEALCSSVSNYTLYGETHVLRCSYYGQIVASSALQCTPVGIQCGELITIAIMIKSH